jgi:hypothetical protein
LKRKLLIANLVLLGLAATLAVHLRREWLEARTREQVVLQQRIKPVPPPPIGALPAGDPVRAAGYADIAQKTLFSKDRNPDVIVEVPAPPPPKPMPPLPVFHGLLNLGDGATAILSEKPGAEHRDFRPGELVGEFKLVAVNNEEIVLEWEGKTITKKVDDMIDRTPAPAPHAAAAAPATAARAIEVTPPPPAHAAPGDDLGGRGISACQKGDTSPAGTVTDGMRKVIKNNPFGASCYWEPVK